MLKSMDELKEAEKKAGVVVNGIDSPNLMSVDSTAPIDDSADSLPPDEETEKREAIGKPKTEKKEEKKEETPPVEKKPEEKKKEEPPQRKVEDEETPDAVQKRINKLTKNWRTAERERDFERAKRQELEEELKKLKSTVPAKDRPKREDFEDDDAYIEALVDWKAEQKIKSSKETDVKSEKEAEEKTAIAETLETIDEVMEQGRKKYDDFNELVLSEDLVLTQQMTEVILQSDNPSEVFYYLGKNPDIALELSKKSVLKIAKEVGKIEVALTKAPEEKKEKKEEKKEEEKKETPPKKKSETPAPIEPPEAGSVSEKDPSQMTPKEYRAWRERNKG